MMHGKNGKSRRAIESHAEPYWAEQKVETPRRVSCQRKQKPLAGNRVSRKTAKTSATRSIKKKKNQRWVGE